MRATLRIPGVPPSLNQIGYRSQQWEEWLGIALMEQRVPRSLRSVAAAATIRFEQRRQRDEGNFRVILEKALGDVLVSAGYLPDDTPEHYRFGEVKLLAPVEVAETIVVLDYVK